MAPSGSTKTSDPEDRRPSILLALKMGALIAGYISDSETPDWATLGISLEQLVRIGSGPHRDKEQVLKAAKGLIHNVRYGQASLINGATEALIKRYIMCKYQSSFEERVLC